MARGHYEKRSNEKDEDSEATKLGLKPQRGVFAVPMSAKAAVDLQVLARE